METTTRYLGTCPVCTAEQKLTTDMRMVHHGFKRPGDGSIHGDCFGVHYPAYELSCEGTKAYLVLVKAEQESVQARLDSLVAGQVKMFLKVVKEWVKGRNATRRVVEVREADGLEFTRLLRVNIAQTESNLKHVGYEVARVEKLIANWAPKAVRTVEEGAREEQANKDARKAEKAAQKAQKLAAKVAGYQKRIDTAMKNKTPSTIADIFEGGPSKIRDLAGCSKAEALKLLNRDHVWALFGLALGQDNDRRLSEMKYFGDTFVWPQA